MFKIGEFSKISRVPAKTLRYYDDIGLFSPSHVDKFTGYRFYSADQLPRLNRILALKDMGLSLSEIAKLLTDEVSPEELRGMFRMKKAEMRQQVIEAEARLARVAHKLKQIEQEGKMPSHDVVLKTIEPQNTLYIRQNAPTPQHIGTLMGEAFGAMAAQGLMPIAPPMTIYYDDEFLPEDMDVATVFPMDPSIKEGVSLDGDRKLEVKRLEGIETAACIVHQGDYTKLDQTYAVLGQWIEDNGYKLNGHIREIYLSAPEEGKEPVTEIQFPVTKA